MTIRFLILLSVTVLLCGCSENRPPSMPVALYPLDGSTVPVDLTLSWICTDPDGDQLRFNVYLSPDVGDDYWKDPRIGYETYFQTLKCPELRHNTVYRWRIEAWDSEANSVSSGIMRFTTLPQ